MDKSQEMIREGLIALLQVGDSILVFVPDYRNPMPTRSDFRSATMAEVLKVYDKYISIYYDNMDYRGAFTDIGKKDIKINELNHLYVEI